MILTVGLTQNMDKLSMLNPPFLLGLINGRSDYLLVYRRINERGNDGRILCCRVIKNNIKLEGVRKHRSLTAKGCSDLPKYAQKA